MVENNDWEYLTPPPTEEELFEAFCYEMYLKYRDEVFAWEGKMPGTSSKDYIKNNLHIIKKLWKEQQKNG